MTERSTSNPGRTDLPKPREHPPLQFGGSGGLVPEVSPADRIIGAFQALETAFAVAGLSGPPLAVIVRNGDRTHIEALMRGHAQLLIADKACSETSIWGICVVERGGQSA